ncbi:unnamed protein product [Adineta steineri]|uniref:TLC domain-containing protein n=1 Tax=Adineta steineri TaxID=433720 RepID=A0A818QCL5_9BILA|nr:unnamed protein product [Adineta steineri]CAF1356524.1 unnamed protein product [Adineta steineri]CAF3556241.1 unnamed protein product [Adineta steineri]CAF3636328.1 unnamed protein product [Adineta steineri]
MKMVSVNAEIPVICTQSSQTIGDNVIRIGVSSLGWLTLYFIMGWISKTLIPGVRSLKAKEQMFWQLAMVRSVCGMCTLWAAYIIYIDGRLGCDHVLSSTDESWTFLSILTGFFIFEESTLIFFDIKYGTFSKELHLHHFFAFSGYFLAAWYNMGHFYAIKGFILEASTPFSCVCWCLLKLKLEHTKVWKINQWILIYVFHWRTVHEFCWWYDIYNDWSNIKANLPLIYTVMMMTGLALVSLWLTPYWTYKKTVQFFNPVDWNVEHADGKKKKDGIDKTS